MELVKSDDPVLRSKTQDYEESEIAGISGLIEDMYETLEKNNGVGLAAPQVGVSRSLFVISIEGLKKTFINPAVVNASDRTVIAEEGCLSLPGLRLKVSRPMALTATWLDENGVRQISDMEGLWARAWLHEFDHLHGVMIDDRVSKLSLDMARKKLKKKIKRINQGAAR